MSDGKKKIIEMIIEKCTDESNNYLLKCLDESSFTIDELLEIYEHVTKKPTIVVADDKKEKKQYAKMRCDVCDVEIFKANKFLHNKSKKHLKKINPA